MVLIDFFLKGTPVYLSLASHDLEESTLYATDGGDAVWNQAYIIVSEVHNLCSAAVTCEDGSSRCGCVTLRLYVITVFCSLG